MYTKIDDAVTGPFCRNLWMVWSAGDPDFLPDNGAVRFRLLYAGNELVSNGNSSQKHVLRKKFHPQLRVLWNTHPLLHEMACQYGLIDLPEYQSDWRKVEGPAAEAYFAKVGNRYSRGNFRFVPLIEADTPMRVSIDILFLRRDQQPLIKEGGDIDNRLKTLFDALRVPDTTDGLGGVPEAGEDPFFVLIQDDSMISEVRVSTDNLLMLPELKAPDPKDAFLVIDVELKPARKTAKNWAFE